MHVGTTKLGEPKTMIRLKHMHSCCFEYLYFMSLKLQQFVLHNFVVNLQDCYYNLCMANQSLNIMISCVDFA
jgi:hypothetical protein